MMVRRKHSLGKGLGQVQIPLYSFSQDPRVPNNPTPIYAVGSPQYAQAVASGANPNAPSFTDAQIAAGAPNIPYSAPLSVSSSGGGTAPTPVFASVPVNPQITPTYASNPFAASVSTSMPTTPSYTNSQMAVPQSAGLGLPASTGSGMCAMGTDGNMYQDVGVSATSPTGWTSGTACPATSTSVLSNIPWYVWLAGAGALYYAFSKGA